MDDEAFDSMVEQRQSEYGEMRRQTLAEISDMFMDAEEGEVLSTFRAEMVNLSAEKPSEWVLA